MLDNEVVVQKLEDLAHLDEGVIFKNMGIGVVKERGSKIGGVAIGDKIIWIGIPASDEILIPENLFERIPDGLEDGRVIFAGIGALAIQAIRESGLTFGEKAIVLGEGILKHILSQMLNLSGIRLLESGSTQADEETDGIFVCREDEADINPSIHLLRNKGVVVVLTEKNIGLSPKLLQEKRLRLVFPGQPQPETRNVCHPPAYMRWTIKKDLGLSLKLLGEIALDDKEQKQRGS